MAAQVGQSGSVLGTDLNLDWIDAGMPRQVELRRHDVTSDEIPSSSYDPSTRDLCSSTCPSVTR
jgi:hypothetical protein